MGAKLATLSESGFVLQQLLVAPRSSAHEWALLVVRGCGSECDLRTLRDWARYVGMSHSKLRELCRMVKIAPHDARDFMRMLRVVLWSQRSSWHPEVFLHVGDHRTLKQLLLRAGLDQIDASPPTLARFLRGQTFVRNETAALTLLEGVLNQSEGAVLTAGHRTAVSCKLD